MGLGIDLDYDDSVLNILSFNYTNESISWALWTKLKLILGLIILIAYHQTGEALMHWTGWSIPGSVVCMLLLFVSLLLFKSPPKSIQQSSEFLLRHLAFLFVPAGVGMMMWLDLIAQEWLAMLVSMVLSTFVSLVFTAWVMQFSMRMNKSDD